VAVAESEVEGVASALSLARELLDGMVVDEVVSEPADDPDALADTVSMGDADEDGVAMRDAVVDAVDDVESVVEVDEVAEEEWDAEGDTVADAV
jgi:hypothetical protein